jgi:hypothetical protein
MIVVSQIVKQFPTFYGIPSIYCDFLISLSLVFNLSHMVYLTVMYCFLCCVILRCSFRVVCFSVFIVLLIVHCSCYCSLFLLLFIVLVLCYPKWGFSVLFTQFWGKCQGIIRKDEARPAHPNFPFSVVCLLFVCKCVMYCCHWVSIQLRLNT